MIKRDRFTLGYIEPKGNPLPFAQCGSCVEAYGDKQGAFCRLMGLGHRISLTEGTCNYYVQGEFNSAGEPQPLITATEAGYLEDAVRCINCASYDAKRSVCLFFEELNSAVPDTFDSDPDKEEKAVVMPGACCNAWEAGEGSEEKAARSDDAWAAFLRAFRRRKAS